MTRLSKVLIPRALEFTNNEIVGGGSDGLLNQKIIYV